LDQFAIKAKIWTKLQKVKNKTGKKSNLKTTYSETVKTDRMG